MADKVDLFGGPTPSGAAPEIPQETSANPPLSRQFTNRDLLDAIQIVGGVGAGTAAAALTGGSSIPIQIGADYLANLAATYGIGQLGRFTEDEETTPLSQAAEEAAFGTGTGLAFRGTGALLKGAKNKAVESFMRRRYRPVPIPGESPIYDFDPSLGQYQNQVIDPVEAAKGLRLYRPTVGQAGGNIRALEVEATQPQMGLKRMAQGVEQMNQAQQMTAPSLGPGSTRASRGEIFQGRASQALKDIRSALDTFRADIFSPLEKTPDAAVTWRGPKGKIQSRVVKNPFFAGETKKAADRMAESIVELGQSPNIPDTLQRELNDVYKVIGGYAQDTARTVDGSNAFVTGYKPFVASYQSIGNHIAQLEAAGANPKVVQQLKGFREAMRKDLQYNVRRTNPSKANDFELYNQAETEYADLTSSKVGKTLAEEGEGFNRTGRLKSPEKGIEAALSSEAEFQKATRLLGPEGTKELLMGEVIEKGLPKGGAPTGFDPKAMRDFVFEHRKKFADSLSSSEKASLNIFLNNAESLARGNGALKIETAIAPDGTRDIIAAVAPIVASGAGTGVAARGFLHGMSLKMESKLFGKKLMDPRFATALAEGSKLPKNASSSSLTARLAKFFIQAGGQAYAKNADGEEIPVEITPTGAIQPENRKLNLFPD